MRVPTGLPQWQLSWFCVVEPGRQNNTKIAWMVSSKSLQIPFSERWKQRGLSCHTDSARLGSPVFSREKAHLFWDLSSLSFGLVRWCLAWETLCSFLVSVRACAVARLEWLLPPTLVNIMLHRRWWARALLYQVKHRRWCLYDCWPLFKTFFLYMRILSKWKKQYLQSYHFWYYFLTVLDTVENPSTPNNCFADCTEAKWYLLLLLFV